MDSNNKCDVCGYQGDRDVYVIIKRPVNPDAPMNQQVMHVCSDCVAADMASPTPKLGLT